MKNIDSDLIRGNIDTIILKTMLDGDKYGLDIIKEVESRSNGTYELKQPTLYSCLKRLENQQLISSYWLDSDIGGRRHYYKLTDKGHETLQKKQEEWAKSKFIIDNLLSNYNYDEYRLVKKDDYDKIIEGKQFVYESPNSPVSETPLESFENNETEYEMPTDENDEDYVRVNDESDLNEFNELESTADQENYHESSPVAEQYNDEELKQIDFTSVENDDDQKEIDFNYGYNQEEDSVLDEVDSDDSETNNYGLSFDENSERENLLEPSTKRHYYVQIDDEDRTFDEVDEDEVNIEPSDINNSDNEDESSEIEYFANNISEDESLENETEETISYEQVDQSSFENNILKRLRSQDEEEINTYYGDQKSYVNHLNLNDELENVDVVQSSMLDITNSSLENDVDETISEFSAAIDELNNFSFAEAEEEPEEIEEPEEEPHTQENINNFVKDEHLLVVKPGEIEYDDEFTNELNELNRNKNNGFFNSFDNPDYEVTKQKSEPIQNTYDFDYNQTDSSDASYESIENDSTYDDLDDNSNDVFNFSFAEHREEPEETQDYSKPQVTNPYDFDEIISNNATSYTSQYAEQNNYSAFTPRYTSENYKQKLSNLSAYSKVTEEKPTQKTINESALSKAKDIETLKSEFEQEGIKIKEFKKYNSTDHSERTYLLSNKIKMVNSLILLFGYVFVLSAVYIILNNTNFKDSFGFSFKYFLFGFIPFGIYAAYHLIMFCINPYKKVPAKLAPRILIFISLIITVQLLLITYCVNLQLGFYSFSQEQYNHLLWIIPTVISFAPIFANVIYISLFYSKNFNV